MSNIFEYIRTQRNTYETESVPLFNGYKFSQYDTINKIDHYWVDSYFEGDAFDDVIGDFPFDNISKYRVLLEARATDFDQKHIEVPPANGSRKSRVASMIATKALHKHMDEINFGEFLNEMAYVRAKYGGVLVSKLEEEVTVEPWTQLVTDQKDIMAAPRIKRMDMSPSELYKMIGVWENVKEAIKTADDQTSADIGNDNSEQAERTGNLIEVFIVEGDIQKSYLLEAQALKDNTEYNYDPEDDYEYVYGRIIVCGADWVQEDRGEKKEGGIVFYAEEETMPRQKYLARNPIAGRGLGEGIVESLFEHQKWHNFTKTEEMRMIAIAGKKLYVTDDPDILANIFDEGVDHGTVLRVSVGKMLTELNQLPTGTPIYQAIRQEWSESANQQTSSYSSMVGEEAKSGTPFRAQYLQNLEASSQFEQYREEMGIFLKEIIEDWVLPDALAKAAKEGEIYETFTPQELQLVDEVIVESNLTDELIKKTLAGEVIDPMMTDMLRMDMQRQLRREGTKRTITDIKEYIREANKQVRVHTTDETRNKAVLFESYSNLLALIDPADPRYGALLDKVMQALGITREELELYADQAVMTQQGQMDGQLLQQENQPRAQAALSA